MFVHISLNSHQIDFTLPTQAVHTAVFSGRVRRTPTDARALLTRKIQEIQKIQSATMSTCSGMRSCSVVICCVYSTRTSFSQAAGPRYRRDRNAKSCSIAKGLKRRLSSNLRPTSRQEFSSIGLYFIMLPKLFKVPADARRGKIPGRPSDL